MPAVLAVHSGTRIATNLATTTILTTVAQPATAVAQPSTTIAVAATALAVAATALA